MLLNILLLALSLAGLVAGAELLIRGAVAVAKRLGMSSFFIGLTIVGFGTSAPELATSIGAAISGQSDIAVGNIVGSNIFNLAVILGLSAVIAPVPVNTRLVRTQLFFMIACAFVPFLAMLSGNLLTRPMGAIMFAVLIAFLTFSYRTDRGAGQESDEIKLERELERELGIDKRGRAAIPLNIAFILAGLGLLAGCANLLVVSSVNLATAFGVSELVIGLTIVSAGTSAPELITSIVAAARKQSDISFGNIIGSNVFNILGIGGVTAVVSPPQLNAQILSLDLPLLCALSLASVPIVWTGQRISRMEGACLAAVYLGYLGALFWLAPQWFPAG